MALDTRSPFPETGLSQLEPCLWPFPARMEALLEESARSHRHLCPRQVLGVRMGLLGGGLLGIEVPQVGKRLLTIMETDGCALDGVGTATNCWPGRRTMVVKDFGKVAATFVNAETGLSVRIVPHPGARGLAREYAPEAKNRWEAYLFGYQRMPDTELFSWREVTLQIPVDAILSHAGHKAICKNCGEEIINGREILTNGKTQCQPCSGLGRYWK